MTKIPFFRNFSKMDKNRLTERTVDKIEVSRKGNRWIFDFKAQSFLWNQIRKMMAVILKIGSNEWLDGVIDELFSEKNSHYALKIEPISPEGLILWEVKYPETVVFQLCGRSMKKLKVYLDSWAEQLERNLSMTGELLSSF